MCRGCDETGQPSRPSPLLLTQACAWPRAASFLVSSSNQTTSQGMKSCGSMRLEGDVTGCVQAVTFGTADGEGESSPRCILASALAAERPFGRFSLQSQQ